MSEVIAKRIKAARKDAGLTQEQLAKACGVSRPAVAQWESMNVLARTAPRIEHARSIARVTGKDVGWFLDDTATPHQRLLRMDAPDANVSPGPDIVGTIPLISWVQAGAFAEVHDLYHVGDFEKEIQVTRRMSQHAFALRVQGDSMQAPDGLSIPEGYIVHVDPARQWENGSIVVAKLEGEQSATLKKLQLDGDKMYLKPLNPRYPLIEVTGECVIVGVVIQVSMEL
jgi:SOS-response transcriptional repressor LexA